MKNGGRTVRTMGGLVKFNFIIETRCPIFFTFLRVERKRTYDLKEVRETVMVRMIYDNIIFIL